MSTMYDDNLSSFLRRSMVTLSKSIDSLKDSNVNLTSDEFKVCGGKRKKDDDGSNSCNVKLVNMLKWHRRTLRRIINTDVSLIDIQRGKSAKKQIEENSKDAAAYLNDLPDDFNSSDNEDLGLKLFDSDDDSDSESNKSADEESNNASGQEEEDENTSDKNDEEYTKDHFKKDEEEAEDDEDDEEASDVCSESEVVD